MSVLYQSINNLIDKNIVLNSVFNNVLQILLYCIISILFSRIY